MNFRLRPNAVRFCCPRAVALTLVLAAVDANAQLGGPTIEAPYELWTINADGSGLHKLVDTRGETCGSPDWTHDGKLIAFDTWHVGQTYTDSQVAVIRADGTGLRVIGPGGMPSWSPNGTQLVCHTYDNPQTVVVMNADGTGRETIINHWGSPRWSPRGNWIACIDRARGITIFDLAAGNERGILSGNYALQIGFSISPDGRRICFGDVSGGLKLATLDESVTRASVRPLVKEGTPRHCSWSPDGMRVVFAGKPSGENLEQMFVLDIDSEKPATRLPGQDRSQSNSCPDWSPDGKTIVFVSQLPRVPIDWVDGTQQSPAR